MLSEHLIVLDITQWLDKYDDISCQHGISMVFLKDLENRHDDQLRKQRRWHWISLNEQSKGLNWNQNGVLIAHLHQLQYLLSQCHNHHLALLLFKVESKFEVLDVGKGCGDCLVLNWHGLTGVEDFDHLLEDLLGCLFFAILEEAFVASDSLQEPHASQCQDGWLLELWIILEELEHLLCYLLVDCDYILEFAHEVQGHLCVLHWLVYWEEGVTLWYDVMHTCQLL